MVDLDSAHDAAHVLNELHIYSRLVSRGNYLIVEDTNTNGHPVMPGTGEGPMEAVQRFLSQNADYRSDERMEKFLMSFNPKGYLISVKGDSEYE